MRLTIPRKFQGIEGMAQGGHVAGLVSGRLDHEVAVTFRAPCPLDEELEFTAGRLVRGDTLILEATPDDSAPEPPPFVAWDEAASARDWAEKQALMQNVSTCFSCGSGPDSLRVHAGGVDGSTLYASPLVHPLWTGPAGVVEHRFLWAPIDCAAGWRVAIGPGARPAVTGRLRVRVHADVRPGDRLVVVADAQPDWDGRKKRARSAIYTEDGSLVAASESLWIAVG